MGTERSFYEILGVSDKATQDELRAAYRRLVKQSHPDVGGSAAIFDMVTEAYRTLEDPIRRAAYDASRRPGSVPPPPRPDESSWQEPPFTTANERGPYQAGASARTDRTSTTGRWRATGIAIVLITLIGVAMLIEALHSASGSSGSGDTVLANTASIDTPSLLSSDPPSTAGEILRATD